MTANFLMSRNLVLIPCLSGFFLRQADLKLKILSCPYVYVFFEGKSLPHLKLYYVLVEWPHMTTYRSQFCPCTTGSWGSNAGHQAWPQVPIPPTSQSTHPSSSFYLSIILPFLLVIYLGAFPISMFFLMTHHSDIMTLLMFQFR